MIGISQVQFPSRESGRLKFFVYLGIVQALSILTMPTSIAISFVAVLYRSEIQTFLTYKKIKNEEVNKKEYWKIFIKDNVIKSVFFLSLVGFTLYLSFTKTLILAWLLAPIPLTMLIILLQPEVRPKKLNPIALFKNAVNLLLDGARENLFGMKYIINTAIEHTLPHLSNDSIIDNINILKDEYGEKIPEPKDVIRNDEFVKFIQYIKGEKEFGNNSKKEFINFFNEWCNNDEQVHVSGLTGGQILYLVLKACNSGDSESVAAKRQELVKSLIYAMNYAKGTVIPETCFTGIIGAAIKSLEGIYPDIRVEYLMEDRIGTDAKDEACKFIKKELQKKKNHEEILNAWDKSDDSSNQITSNFIQEIKIPLMRNLFSLDCSEQTVLTLMEDIGSMKLNMLEDSLLDHIRNKLKENGLDNQESLLENIGEKVFLELLNQNLLKTDFSLKGSSLDGAKRIANKIIIGEVEKFRSEAAEKARKVNPIEAQVDVTLQNLSALPREKKCCIAYSRLSSQYKGDEREIMENILLKKLEITKKEMNKMLEENDIRKLKLALDDACKKSGKSMEEMIKEVEEVVSRYPFSRVV